MYNIMEAYGINQSVIITTEGKQYQQAGYYDKALKQYNFALNMYIATLATYEDSEVFLEDEISLLFLLFDLVEQIKICYGELKEIHKHFIFLENSIEIIKTLGKYEDKLKVDEFIAYKNISKLIELPDEDASLLDEFRAEFKNPSQFIDNSDDPIFRELCSNFDKCCSYRKCLLSSKGASIIDTKKSLTQSPVQMSHVVAAILFPPLGVFLTVGLGIHFWIDMVLTFVFTWLPGMIHAVWLVYNHDRS